MVAKGEKQADLATISGVESGTAHEILGLNAEERRRRIALTLVSQEENRGLLLGASERVLGAFADQALSNDPSDVDRALVIDYCNYILGQFNMVAMPEESSE